jgi:hypothetical protein
MRFSYPSDELVAASRRPGMRLAASETLQLKNDQLATGGSYLSLLASKAATHADHSLAHLNSPFDSAAGTFSWQRSVSGGRRHVGRRHCTSPVMIAVSPIRDGGRTDANLLRTALPQMAGVILQKSLSI